MKTIEERVKEYVKRHGGGVANHCFGFGRSYRMAYEAGAIEQKAIDIDIASIILCRYVCPHKIDSNKCLNSKCNNWEIFRKMMEEYTC